MHILILPSWYKNYPGDVLGSFFEEQARALLKAGHQVSIHYQIFFPLSALFKKKIKQPGIFDDDGLLTYTYNIQGFFPRSRKFNDAFEAYHALRKFERYVKKFGMPDVIHAHSVFHAGYFGAHISKKYNIPLVITEHLTHYLTGRLSLNHDIPLAQKIFKEADCSLVVGSVFKEELAKSVSLPVSTFRVVNNMVADLFFNSNREKKYQQGDEFIFFTNSFINPRKNHQLIFNALKIIIEKGYNVKLIVGGSGETADELKEYVKANSLTTHVEFKGALSRVAVKENVDNCHAFVLASTYETFGVVLIEALAGGKPVISTNSGGPQDIIKSEKLGYLLKTFEAEEFANAMESMINNYSSFNQKEISKYTQNNFSENVISNQLITIYNELIQKRKEHNNF